MYSTELDLILSNLLSNELANISMDISTSKSIDEYKFYKNIRETALSRDVYSVVKKCDKLLEHLNLNIYEDGGIVVGNAFEQ